MSKGFDKQGFGIETPDLRALQERIARLEAQLNQDRRGALVETKEKTDLAKREISAYIQEVQQTPSFASPAATRDESAEIRNLPVEQQVGALVSLALSDGLTKAISVAMGLGGPGGPAVLDELHDTLVDSYFKQLVEMGVIKLL